VNARAHLSLRDAALRLGDPTDDGIPGRSGVTDPFRAQPDEARGVGVEAGVDADSGTA